MDSTQPTLFQLDTPTARQGVDSAPYAAVQTMPPLSRDKDPLPSYQAAEQLNRTGLSGKQRVAVYHALRANQGLTSAELAQAMGSDRYCPSRRLPELAKLGWVCRGPRRRCKVSGIICATWWIARPWKEKPKDPAPVPCAAKSATTDARSKGQCRDESARVLTVAERRELRRRMAAQGDARAKAVTEALDGKGATL